MLNAVPIATARVPGMSAHRRGLLVSGGILSAADLERQRFKTVSGLGGRSIALLLIWRDELAASASLADGASQAPVPGDPSFEQAAASHRLLKSRVNNDYLDLRELAANGAIGNIAGCRGQPSSGRRGQRGRGFAFPRSPLTG